MTKSKHKIAFVRTSVVSLVKLAAVGESIGSSSESDIFNFALSLAYAMLTDESVRSRAKAAVAEIDLDTPSAAYVRSPSLLTDDDKQHLRTLEVGVRYAVNCKPETKTKIGNAVRSYLHSMGWVSKRFSFTDGRSPVYATYCTGTEVQIMRLR